MLKLNKTIQLFLLMVVCFGLAGCSQISKTEDKDEGSENSYSRKLDYDWPLNKILLESLENFGKLQIDGYQVDIVRQEGDFVLGSVVEREAGEKHSFWAYKANNSWQVLLDEESKIPCSELRSRSFPENLLEGCANKIDKEVFNFNDCQASGYEVINSTPRQCIDANGNVFIQVTENNEERYYCSEISEDCLAVDISVCGCNEEGPVQSFANKCLACEQEGITYWLEGECK